MNVSSSHDVFRLAQVFTISRGSRSQVEVLSVTVEKNGFIGRGECVPYARYNETLFSVDDELKNLPQEINRQRLPDFLPAGAARNAVDCALWDLEAKTSGKRVWQLAGLPKPRPEISAYTLSLDTPRKMYAQAVSHAFRPLLKIKLGTPDDMPRLEAVRAGAPKSDIIVDANEGWSAEVYKDLAPHLIRNGVKLVEQPLAATEDDALLGMDRPVPVCADESCHDRSSLANLSGKYDFVNIKLDKTGGLTEALALRQKSLQLGYNIMVGCMIGSSLAMAPATLVAQGATITDLDGPLLLAEDRNYPLLFDKEGIHPPSKDLWG